MSDGVITHFSPLNAIVDTDPVPQAVLDASGWYETETQSVKVNLLVNNGAEGQQALAWAMAQGWYVVSSATGRSTDADGELFAHYTIYKLRRRAFKAETALQALIQQTTTAYNEGRELNDSRYDDIISLYNTLINRVENGLIVLDDEDGDTADKIKEFADLFPDDYEEHAANPDLDLGAYGTAQRARINLQYDNLLTTLKQSLIQRGMYTTTVYDTDVIGIEGERTIALNAFEDDLMRLKADMAHKLYDQKISMRQGVMNAYERFSTVRDNGMNALQLQSKICMAMLNFMERREDGYPDISAISQTAAQFGSANSTEVAP